MTPWADQELTSKTIELKSVEILLPVHGLQILSYPRFIDKKDEPISLTQGKARLTSS